MVEGADDADKETTRRRRQRERRLRRKERNRRYYRRSKQRLSKTAFYGYDGFVAALIARRHALGWSQLELDERAGFQSGYSGKLENWRGPQGRVAGSITMTLWLQALGIGFVPVAMVDGRVSDQARILASIIRPPLAPTDHNRRIPPKGKP